MTQLPAYSGPGLRGSTECPKCCGIDISREYRRGLVTLVQANGLLSEVVRHGATGECLIRQCRDCSYAWLEACADTPPVESES